MKPIFRLEIVTESQAIFAVFEVFGPEEMPKGDWFCLIRESTEWGVRDRKVIQGTCYYAIRVAIDMIVVLVQSVSVRAGLENELSVEGFRIKEWVEISKPSTN